MPIPENVIISTLKNSLIANSLSLTYIKPPFLEGIWNILPISGLGRLGITAA